MSLKWPSKDPDEILDYSLDWSRYLGSNIISTVTWFFYDADDNKTLVAPNETVNGLRSGAQLFSDTVATIVLEDGTVNSEYKVTCQINFGSGLTAERTVLLQVREH